MGIHGYVLVYSIANRQSFELVQTIYDKLLEATSMEWAPCVVVGNKSDLEGARSVSSPSPCVDDRGENGLRALTQGSLATLRQGRER